METGSHSAVCQQDFILLRELVHTPARTSMRCALCIEKFWAFWKELCAVLDKHGSKQVTYMYLKLEPDCSM